MRRERLALLEVLGRDVACEGRDGLRAPLEPVDGREAVCVRSGVETTVAGEPITTFAPSSAGAGAYRDLAREVAARCLAG